MRHQYGYFPRHHVSVEHDSTAVKPKVLFIGNSYFWAMQLFVPFQELFETSEFWFYSSTAYFGEDFSRTADVKQLDFLEKMLSFDYVVWFTTGNQINKGTEGFAERTLLNLCYNNNETIPTYDRIIDSLRHDSLTLATLDTPLSDNNYKEQLWPIALLLVYDHPERYFPEIASDSLPTVRSPRIKEVLAINEIKKDSVWLWNLATYQTVIQNASLEQVLLMEAHNLIDSKPLLRDMPDPEAKRDRVEQLVAAMIEEIKPQTELMERIRTIAKEKGITIEEQTELAARWIVNDKINKGIVVL
jgi:hypothetical protein